MKIAIIAVIVYLLAPISGYSLDASKFFRALESHNIQQIFRNINVESVISIEEISKFFQDMKETCEVRYGVSISLLQLQQDMIEICKQNIVNPIDFYKVECFLDELFDPQNINIASLCLFLASNKKGKYFFEDKNIPMNIILGCIEIGCGILLWITPFKTIANILLADGCRRMLNEVEIIGKTRNYSHNMFQKLVSSGTILYKI